MFIKILISIFSLLFLNFKGAEGDEGEGDDGASEDLQKALDDNLSELETLLESDSEDSISELMKSKEGRKKMKEMMKEADDDDDDEDEDEEKMKGKGSKCKGYSDMKKSIGDIDEQFEGIIDGNEILKSFITILDKNVEAVNSLHKSLSNLESKQVKTDKLVKSLGNVTTNSAQLIKSFSESVEKIGSSTKKPKGVEGEGLLKSIQDKGDGAGETKIPVSVQRDILMKSFEDGKIGFDEISIWENSRYNPEALSDKALNIIREATK
jgi:hypothetical protein